MKEKPFGRDGRLVSIVGQGTWPLPDRDALRIGIQLGMTHIDTAEMYGDGRSEEIVAQAIHGLPRESLFIVSKVSPQNSGSTKIGRACEGSLRRLKTDYLDCYLLHWRGDVPIEESMQGLERLVESGKVRSLGVSNLDPWDLREASAALTKERIGCNQVLYNVRERTVEEHELPWAREYGCAIVAYTPLGRPPLDGTTKKVRVLAEIADRHKVSAQTVALAFLLRDPLVFVIPKANRSEHVRQNASAGELELAADEMLAIDRAFARATRRGPLPTN